MFLERQRLGIEWELGSAVPRTSRPGKGWPHTAVVSHTIGPSGSLSFPLQPPRKLVTESQHCCCDLLPDQVTAYCCLAKENEMRKELWGTQGFGVTPRRQWLFFRGLWSSSLGKLTPTLTHESKKYFVLIVGK